MRFGIVLASLVWAATVAAKPTRAAAPLGRIDFPVTGPEVARRHFVRGMLALHSFWYDEARDEFVAATQAAPDFAMGYWGEALTSYHPVWEQENVAKSRAALAKVPPRANVSARERAYLDAARELVSEGDRATRWRRYAEAMRAVHARWPDDDEAATLYAVALLGIVDRKATGFKRQAEAAAIGLEVLAKNPDHPGAAHYVIHAFDDPDHAVLALPAARRYARIAPEAHHARHMPSHIFVQLGMWPEAMASNEAAWEASDAWVRKKKLDLSYHDYHSLEWLHAIALERGQRRKAEEVLGRLRADLLAAREGRPWLRAFFASMVVVHVVATDDWASLDKRLAPLEAQAMAAADPAAEAASAAAATGHAACHGGGDPEHAARGARMEQAWVAYGRGLAGLQRRDAATVERAATALAAVIAKMEGDARDDFRVRELELRGRLAAQKGDLEGGLKKLRVAAELEERAPPSGPVLGVTVRERLGELLLAHRRAADALQAFRRALELHPRRARALLGAAQAAQATEDAQAVGYFAELADVWAHADADQPGLAEVRRAVAPK
jgi:tetratricopeptide (TPR) repeat protein